MIMRWISEVPSKIVKLSGVATRTALNNPPARFGVSAGNVFDHLG